MTNTELLMNHDSLFVDISKPGTLILGSKNDFLKAQERAWFSWDAYNIVAYKIRKGYYAYVREGEQYRPGRYYNLETFKHELFIAAL